MIFLSSFRWLSPHTVRHMHVVVAYSRLPKSFPPNLTVLPGNCYSAASLHTTAPVKFLRKPRSNVRRIFGVPLTYIPWPSMLLKALIRKRYNKEYFGDEAHRRSMFNRLSIVYALLAWSAVGVLVYAIMFSDGDGKQENHGPNPGSAMWYYNSLKSPDDILQLKDVKLYKMKGLSVDKKLSIIEEIQQNKEVLERLNNNEYLLRKRMKIPSESAGGMSTEALKALLESQGKDYEMEIILADDFYRRDQFGDRRSDDELPDNFEGNMRRRLRKLLKSISIFDHVNENYKEEAGKDVNVAPEVGGTSAG